MNCAAMRAATAPLLCAVNWLATDSSATFSVATARAFGKLPHMKFVGGQGHTNGGSHDAVSRYSKLKEKLDSDKLSNWLEVDTSEALTKGTRPPCS